MCIGLGSITQILWSLTDIEDTLPPVFLLYAQGESRRYSLSSYSCLQILAKAINGKGGGGARMPTGCLSSRGTRGRRLEAAVQQVA